MKSAEKVVLYRLAASLLLTASTLHLLGLPAWPHGGGLDAHGCHHNRVHGGYHCHRGAFKGAMFDSKAAMLQALEASAPAAVQEFTGKVVGVSDGDTNSPRWLKSLAACQLPSELDAHSLSQRAVDNQ